jgi:predicted secreted hydrolase
MTARGFRTTAAILAALLALAAHPAAAAAGNQGFLQVAGPCRLEFPRDHGPHPGFRTEWWYYTGNLFTDTGRRFGFQLTFFRYQLTAFGGAAAWPEPHSAWRTRQIYIGHAALSDPATKRHFQAERAARGALGMAGAVQEGAEVTVFLNDWRAVLLPDGHSLEAAGDEFAFQLELKPVKEPVRHGIEGYSRKGAAPERASCYYSFSRLEAGGTVTVSGKSLPVKGLAWMDHEFSTAPLEPEIAGWDWFSLQLADGSEIMIFILRRRDGGIDPASSGSYIDRSGALRHLERSYFAIETLATWKSAQSGAVYPSRWRIAVPLAGIDAVVSSILPDQEMRTGQTTGIVYWEGGVDLKGTKNGEAVAGHGYVELTGYAGPVAALK